ncbi:hypothetical protein BGW38_006701 [Lunasporangiospora selenospora]|uniref:F-box domain-containing protein n=1 Tax=Lunasporangiospora selenospora TaxID=979761 RepID=A0A9P6FND9_9FUNG|nr:hypothetical protein BGW38_006701 [Lunasporangiospora selenospora]
MEKALTLPEIKSNIGRFLCIKDLVTCTLISKTWYESMLPWLWRFFQVPKDERQIEYFTLHKLMLRNGPLIRNLLVTRVPRFIDIFTNCNQLESLECRGRLFDDCDFNLSVLYLVQKCRASLTRFIQGYGIRLSTETLIHALDCPKLDWVEIRAIDLVGDALWDSVTRLCMRVHRLSINYIHLPENCTIPWTAGTVFPNLEHLTALGTQQVLALEVASRSPNLKYLHINVAKSGVGHLVETLPFYPKLQVLVLDECRQIRSKDMVELLDALPPMKSIQYDCALTTLHPLFPTYYASLQRHFDTIQEITLSHQWRLVSPLAILCSCPNLRALTGGLIDCRAVLCGSPWVCTGLRLFRVSLDLRIMAIGITFVIRIFCSQLAHLQQLQVLDLSVSSPYRSTHMTGSWLRLGNGLEHLKSLKMLQQCSLVNWTLNLEAEDIEWIRTHWPNFWGLRGRLHDNPRQNEQLWKLCEKYGIHYNIIRSKSLDFVDL